MTSRLLPAVLALWLWPATAWAVGREEYLEPNWKATVGLTLVLMLMFGFAAALLYRNWMLPTMSARSAVGYFYLLWIALAVGGLMASWIWFWGPVLDVLALSYFVVLVLILLGWFGFRRRPVK